MPIHAEFFLPARRTDLIAVNDDYDIDLEHKRMWEESDPRNRNEVDRPTKNNYEVAMLIAQGRIRRHAQRYYVKDPATWEEEALDLRTLPVEEGRWRCQFCGQDFERPRQLFCLACWDCSELIGLRTYFGENLWDKERNLR